MRRVLIAVHLLVAAWSISFCVLLVVQARYSLAALNGGAALINDGLAARLIMEVRRGNRRAARDRDNPDFGSLTLGAFSSGSIAFGPGGSATAADPGLTETVADVPILAFKRCHLRWSEGGRFSLVANHTGVPLAVDADAKCVQSMPTMTLAYYSQPPEAHDSPGVKCSCGFYAVKDPEQLNDSYGMVAVDVELSGRVIVATNGYRAGHQRVLRASIGGCYFCGEPVSGFAVGVESNPLPAGMISFGPTVQSNVRALCSTHTTPDQVIVSPEIVSARLGIPFDVRASA